MLATGIHTNTKSGIKSFLSINSSTDSPGSILNQTYTPNNSIGISHKIKIVKSIIILSFKFAEAAGLEPARHF